MPELTATTPCPKCNRVGLRIEWRFKAQPLGSYSLAGAQPKVSAYRVPVLLCDNCGLSCEGRLAEEAELADG